MSDDEAAIFALIERETFAFLTRDLEGWSDCWLRTESVRRLGALMGGMMEYQEGWRLGYEMTERFFERFPVPNPEAARTMRRTNVSIRASESMAWVSFDQYGAPSDDPLVTVGLSHQVRILEKVDGDWKIVMAGHGDTTLEYFDFPVVRVDEACRIEWMNDAAKAELAEHPALAKSGAYLRGKYGADDKRLRQAVLEMSSLTVMERRPSIRAPRGRLADPVVLSGGTADEQHVVWVSVQDGGLLVSFRDRNNERARLEQAAEMFELSPTQVQVAELILEGLSLQNIAGRLDVSVSTAKTHLARVFDNTGARSQPALVSTLLGVGPPR